MKLGVNIDHAASLRRLRSGAEPVITECASLCEKAGADSIVVHLREDRRHIQDADVYALKKSVKTELNLEMSVNTGIVRIACDVRPGQATLVPERRREVTTEGGLDVTGSSPRIGKAVQLLKQSKIPVSMFIDPDRRQILASGKLGVERLEFHTGRYANAKNKEERKQALAELKEACSLAASLGFHVYAGHGLDYDNVKSITGIPEIEELNIGYSIICRSVTVGLPAAVREMKKLIAE